MKGKEAGRATSGRGALRSGSEGVRKGQAERRARTYLESEEEEEEDDDEDEESAGAMALTTVGAATGCAGCALSLLCASSSAMPSHLWVFCVGVTKAERYHARCCSVSAPSPMDVKKLMAKRALRVLSLGNNAVCVHKWT